MGFSADHSSNDDEDDDDDEDDGDDDEDEDDDDDDGDDDGDSAVDTGDGSGQNQDAEKQEDGLAAYFQEVDGEHEPEWKAKYASDHAYHTGSQSSLGEMGAEERRATALLRQLWARSAISRHDMAVVNA